MDDTMSKRSSNPLDFEAKLPGGSPEVHPEAGRKMIRGAVSQLLCRLGNGFAVVEQLRRPVHLELFVSI